jgi:hypothetical protein
MASTTGSNDFSTPLLRDLPQQESDADGAYDEECCMPCSLKTNVDDDKDEELDYDSSQCNGWCDKFANLVVLEEESDYYSDDSSKNALWCDNFVALVFLPALLFLSFGEAFYTTSVDAGTGLRWSAVNCTIVMFVVIATLYRQALHECKITCPVALLLPEILMDIVLSLVLCSQVVPAFWLLLSSIVCLGVFAVASSICVLVLAKASTVIDEGKGVKNRNLETA